MKRFFLFYLLILFSGLIFCVSNSFALGLGVNYSTSSGSGDIDPDDSSSVDVDTSYSGFGFVLDSAVSQDNLFNYRLNIQYGTLTYEPEGMSGDLDLDQFTLDNTFGFRLYRNKLVRIWMGPQIRLSYASGDEGGTDFSQVGFGIAPVVGVNFNPGKVVSPALTIGYRYNMVAGVIENGGEDLDYTATYHGPFLNLTVLFRLNE